MLRADDFMQDSADRARARAVGTVRDNEGWDMGRKQTHGSPGRAKSLKFNCYAAFAEKAVSNWLGLPWTDLLDDLSGSPADVGDNVEVRWTATNPVHGHVIAHDDDPDGFFLVGVMGELPDMWIVGWTTAGFAKQERFQNHKHARNPLDFWVPAKELLMCELMEQMTL
jgi:hypothetical protein